MGSLENIRNGYAHSQFAALAVGNGAADGLWPDETQSHPLDRFHFFSSHRISPVAQIHLSPKS
jgi:hypothetical protein